MRFTLNTPDWIQLVARFCTGLVAVLALTACASLGVRNGSASSAPPVSGSAEKTQAAPAKTASNERPCRSMKSKDGSFEGCVYGNPPASSKFSKLVIGMSKYQVEKLLGHPQDLKYITNWRKAIIPFYQGTDARRLVWLYESQGSVSFDTGGAYSDGGMVVEINYDPKIEL